MKTFNQIREQSLEEKLTATDPTGSWIHDFVHSDNPKFAGKSKKERIKMALGAAYAAKKNEEVDFGEGTHRVGLTVTDPNHPMVSKRAETIQKTVRVSGADSDDAIKKAVSHYRKKGYKIHDQHYIGVVNEEEGSQHEKAEENKRSADAAKKQGDMFAHHLHMADHHENLAQWHEARGRNGEAARHSEKAESHHEKAMSMKESSDMCNVCGQTPCNCTSVSEDKDPCWDNYKQIGMKKKNGKQVPNCVPEAYDDNRTGFSKSPREDDEYHNERKPKFVAKDTLSRPHTVHIDGKPWKKFSNGSQAHAAASTLRGKGKNAVAIAHFNESDEICSSCKVDPCICDESHGFVSEQEANYGNKYQSMVSRVAAKAKEQEKKKPVDINALAARLRQAELNSKK